jgi:guanylate kinase
MMKRDKGVLTVLSGFSGAGKGTIMKHLLNAYPDVYNLSISATTRKPREGEEEGREYFFKTKEEFEQMIKDDAFLEYASFNNNYYGTPKAYVEKLIDEGKDVILEIEVQGALQVKTLYPDCLLLFVTPPSANALKERLVKRGTESDSEIADRLSISFREAALMPKYDYLIINDVLDEAVESVNEIIQKEHFQTRHQISMIEDMQRQLKVFSKGENL